VNGIRVTVPKYLQVGFPATFVPFVDFVGQIDSFIGYDIEVIGNYVESRQFEPIAGQIMITQTNLMGGQGIIASIDTATGDITLQEGNVIRIVDPAGVYGPPTTQHEFFTSDPENPSISAFSGFPMCVKSANTAEWCLDANRPTNAQRTNFVPPNPLAACPLAPGDAIDYAGMEADGKIWVWSVVVMNLNLLTSDTTAAYLRIEDALIGVFNPDPNVESARDRFVGFLSSANANNLPVKIQGIKPDVCTGLPTYVDLGTVTEAVPPRNKFDWRSGRGGAATYFREYLLTGAKTPVPWKTAANNKPEITVGSYVMPVSEWIQAELVQPGLLPPRNDFANMYHLATGLGWDGTNVWRALTPFPQSGVTLRPSARPAAPRVRRRPWCARRRATPSPSTRPPPAGSARAAAP
jgi:hypothetical protein